MATKIRLQRHGRKGKPFYWIVTADSRTKRDGKFIEKLGTYNPMVNPAQINLNIDATVKWIHNGAQPTETAKRLLSYEGVLLKHHLEVGVRKGAMTTEEAEKKFQIWQDEKTAKVESKVEKLQGNKESERNKRIQSEREYREAKIAEVASEQQTVEEASNPESSTNNTPEKPEDNVSESKEAVKS